MKKRHESYFYQTGNRYKNHKSIEFVEFWGDFPTTIFRCLIGDRISASLVSSLMTLYEVHSEMIVKKSS